MFDFFSWGELFLIAVIGLLVIGPDRLPETLRTIGLWLGRMRRSFTSVKNEIEKEIGMDEVRRQLHNEAIMAEMKRIEDDVKGTVDEAKQTIHPSPPPPQKPETEPEPETQADAAANETSNGKD